MDSSPPDVSTDHFSAGQRLPPHRHTRPYVALVVEGTYVEASFDGRFPCAGGSLIVHPSFHEHANEFGAAPCVVLNLPVDEIHADLAGYRVVRTPNPEALVQMAHEDPHLAGRAAIEELNVCAPIAPPDWVLYFVNLLMADWPVAAAACKCGVTAEHASRTTARWFAATPTHLRREGRIRKALFALRDGAGPAEAAAHAGFSDQPHLTRVLKAATGLTPARIRRH